MTLRIDPDPIDIAIGARIRFRRNELGLTQEALSAAVAMSYQQLQRYERGEHRLAISTLAHIAAHLATTIGWLVGEEDHQPLNAATLAGLARREAPTLLAAYDRIERPDDRGLVLRLAEALARPDLDWPGGD